MGWSSGSELMSKCISTIKAEVADVKSRKRIYKKLINAFEGEDCDTLYECEGEDDVFDEALKASQE